MFKVYHPGFPAYTYTFHIVCCSKCQLLAWIFAKKTTNIMDEKGCCAIDLDVGTMSQWQTVIDSVFIEVDDPYKNQNVTESLSIPHLDGAWPPDPLPKLENGIHQCFCMGRTAWNVDVNRDNSVHTPHHWVRVVVIATTIGTAGSVCKAGQWSVCDSNIMFGLDQSLLTNHLNLGQLVPVVQRNIQLQVVKLLNAVQSRSTDSTFGLIR